MMILDKERYMKYMRQEMPQGIGRNSLNNNNFNKNGLEIDKEIIDQIKQDVIQDIKNKNLDKILEIFIDW